MLQNSRVTAFTVFELLKENQLEGKIIAFESYHREHKRTDNMYIFFYCNYNRVALMFLIYF